MPATCCSITCIRGLLLSRYSGFVLGRVVGGCVNRIQQYFGFFDLLYMYNAAKVVVFMFSVRSQAACLQMKVRTAMEAYFSYFIGNIV